MIRTLLVVFLSLSSAIALADSKDFAVFLQEYQAHCSSNDDADCTQPYQQTTIFSADEKSHSSLYQKVKKQIEQAAFNHAQVWADTILEGEYVADGKTEVDHVMAIYKNGALQAYHITYSEKAWCTGGCDYDYENEETLQDCQPGRISESAYVSADFKYSERDENGYADFYED